MMKDAFIGLVVIAVLVGWFVVAAQPNVSSGGEMAAVLADLDGYRQQYAPLVPSFISPDLKQELGFWDAINNLLFLYTYGPIIILVGSIAGLVFLIIETITVPGGVLLWLFKAVGIILISWFLPFALWWGFIHQIGMTYPYFLTMVLLGWPTVLGPLFLLGEVLNPPVSTLLIIIRIRIV